MFLFYHFSGVENKHEIYSLCQIDKDCNATSDAITAGTIQSKNDETLTKNEKDERYAYKSLPQRLLEELTVDNPSSSSRATIEAENNVVIAAPARNNNNNDDEEEIFCQSNTSARQNIAAGDLPSVENSKKPSRGLRKVQLLSVSDFLVPCSSSSSPSTSSLTGPDVSNSNSRLTDGWLMPASSETLSALKSTDADKKLPEKLNKSKLTERKLFSSNAETPKPATVDVFVPFTEDMNKGFLGFADDEKGLTSKCKSFFSNTRYWSWAHLFGGVYNLRQNEGGNIYKF